MTTQRFVVPQVGGLADVEIVEWRVKVGDRVSEHQTLAEVETDKSVLELPSPFTGVVLELHGARGDRLDVGALLAVIDAEGAPAASPAPEPSRVLDADARSAGANAQNPSVGPENSRVVGAEARSAGANAQNPSGGGGRRRAAPSVRRLARELGVALSDVEPTGRGGIVTADDVRGAAGGNGALRAAPVTAAGRDTTVVKLTGVRRATARNMTAVARVPHITSQREVEVSDLLRWREHVNGRRPERPITLAPFLALCTVAALRAVPRLNATFDEDAEEITQHGAVHLGIATATDDGLLVPVVHDADLLSLEGLSDAIDSLAAAARARTLTPVQGSGGTFTVTNYGARGGWFATPLLRLPEIGIAGFGRVTQRPWVRDGQLVVGNVLPLSISVDHRVIDGDVAGQFADALAGFLSDPLRFL